jgi:hypothetical protein
MRRAAIAVVADIAHPDRTICQHHAVAVDEQLAEGLACNGIACVLRHQRVEILDKIVGTLYLVAFAIGGDPQGIFRKPGDRCCISPRQNAVLEQALRLLVDGGEKALTTSGVARAANCSKESLYKWFGDRDGAAVGDDRLSGEQGADLRAQRRAADADGQPARPSRLLRAICWRFWPATCRWR